MKHVSILLLQHLNLAGMENARQGFLETNAYFEMKGLPPIFKVELIGLDKQVKLNQGLYTIQADRLISEVEHTDFIVIPPIQRDIGGAIKENRAFSPWITQRYKNGAQVASLCLGAFILGSTGLLEGRKCATHWRAAREFRKLFPGIELVEDKILTDEQGIYTGGGAFSSANLLLYLIEKTAGKDAAVYCSKIFQVDMDRKSQSPFIIFKGQKDHPDDEVREVQCIIEKNYGEKLTVGELCKKAGIGRRTLERRFKKATGNTVLEYIQRVKVEAGKRELEHGRKTVNEVMYEVGYSDTSAFRKLFKKITGMTPVDYRSRYN